MMDWKEHQKKLLWYKVVYEPGSVLEGLRKKFGATVTQPRPEPGISRMEM
jgi:hypothetical protein